jgi:hypothetical protein
MSKPIHNFSETELSMYVSLPATNVRGLGYSRDNIKPEPTHIRIGYLVDEVLEGKWIDHLSVRLWEFIRDNHGNAVSNLVDRVLKLEKPYHGTH